MRRLSVAEQSPCGARFEESIEVCDYEERLILLPNMRRRVQLARIGHEGKHGCLEGLNRQPHEVGERC